MTWVVPNEDAVTLGELNGELYSVSKRDDARVGDEFIRRGGCVLPPARVASSKPRPFGQGDSLTDEQDEEVDSGALRLLKRALGTAKILLMDDEQAVLNRALDTVGSAAQRLLKAATDEEELELETQEANSNGESIVGLSWHPTRNALAVAQIDGVVALYNVESASWDARVLEHPKQVDIGSIEWGKFTGDTIAVACRTGLFLWKVPQKSKEPVLMEILKHPSNAGFSQVCWNADGSLLAAFGKGSKSVIVFDAIFSRSTELQSPYKLSSLHWSPTGEYLFVITESGVSLMWETLTWKRETWEVAAGGCGWSSDGRCLLVGLRNSALLYPYIFQDCPPSIDAQISSPALDFAETELFSLDRSTSVYAYNSSCRPLYRIVGGKVQDVAWDPSGSRVAVSYRTSAIGSHQAGTAKLVAIFSVAWQPFLIFTRRFVLNCLVATHYNRTNLHLR
ncbi:Aladin [Phytophthora nicotianae]|uniref:Aladin n=1 Tax=Phytophthora nicotianae TaxID=4792 RepID=A0A0W8C5X0_PHYNI|nr:Aladin [Phytophthora nicotianae]KUF84731.1 Aladin [Phytophthora nicotianae]